MAKVTVWPTISAGERDADSPITQELVQKYVDRDRALTSHPPGYVGDENWSTLQNPTYVDMTPLAGIGETVLWVPVWADILVIECDATWNIAGGSPLAGAVRFKLGTTLVDAEFDMFADGVAQDTRTLHTWVIDVPSGDRETYQVLKAQGKVHSTTSNPSNVVAAGWFTSGSPTFGSERMFMDWDQDPEA